MGDSYVVKKGDSLSKIGQERWKEIYRENRSKIGDDPNIIKPGQELTVPPEVIDVSEMPPAPAAPVTDEYVEIDPAHCMLQSCEIESCDSADTFYMPAYWSLGPRPCIDSVALDYLSVKEVSDTVRRLFAISRDPDESVASNAVRHLKRMAAGDELTALELKAASRHESPAVRLIAATNARTSLYTLFELAREKDEDGDYTWRADKAANNIELRAKGGKLSPEELTIAAGHENSSIRFDAAINGCTPLETLFELAREKDADGDYSWRADRAVDNIEFRILSGRLFTDTLRTAAKHENPSLRTAAATNDFTPLETIFELAKEKDEDGDYTWRADKAAENFARRARGEELSPEELTIAAGHENSSLRWKVAINQRTLIKTLFELAKEKDEDGDYTGVANKAAENIERRAKGGKLSPEELTIAAGHENSSIRFDAAINGCTPLETLFELAREKDADGDYSWRADRAVDNIGQRHLFAKHIEMAAAHERDSLRKMATNLIAPK